MNEKGENDFAVEEPVVSSLERRQWWTVLTAILALDLLGLELWMFCRTSSTLGDLA